MTTENAVTTHTTAALAAPGATVAPEKASAKKTTSPKKGAPQSQKPAKGGKPKATTAAATKSQEAPPVKGPAKRAQAAQARNSAGPRAGSKTAQVVALLQRKNGPALASCRLRAGAVPECESVTHSVPFSCLVCASPDVRWHICTRDLLPGASL